MVEAHNKYSVTLIRAVIFNNNNDIVSIIITIIY